MFDRRRQRSRCSALAGPLPGRCPGLEIGHLRPSSCAVDASILSVEGPPAKAPDGSVTAVVPDGACPRSRATAHTDGLPIVCRSTTGPSALMGGGAVGPV